MSDMQDQLAELLKAGVGDPPAPVTVRAVRQERARRHIAGTVGTLAILAVAGVISASLIGRSESPGPAVSGPTVPCHNGWSVSAGAVPAGDRQDRLVALAGSSSDDIWAVGVRLPDGRHVFPLMEHWDGRRWTYFAGAPLGGRQASLTGVAVLAPDDAWVIGNFGGVGPSQTGPLIEHWNGTSWSLRPTHALDRLSAKLPQTLTSVATLTAKDVWVLGTPGSNSSDVYLHWNGSSWKLLRGPKIGVRLGSAAMQLIKADHDGQLWAVGGWMRTYGEGGLPGGGTVERWTGRQWKVDRPAAWAKPLTMIAPIAPDDLWAITGGSFTTSGTYGIGPVQVLHWNGRHWQVALRLGSASSVNPTGLVVTPANDVYVTGQSAASQPFIRHWDGTSWRTVPMAPDSAVVRDASLAVTSDGTIAALDTKGLADRVNLLWLRCPS
jgi:hypothetical protein